MGRNRIVWNTHSHPDGTRLGLLTIRATAHHLQHPRLLLVGNGESLTLGIIAILFHERGHDLKCLACRLRTLKGDVDQRTVVNDSRGVCHLLTSTEGCLTDGDLPLVGITDDIICLQGLCDIT